MDTLLAITKDKAVRQSLCYLALSQLDKDCHPEFKDQLKAMHESTQRQETSLSKILRHPNQVDGYVDLVWAKVKAGETGEASRVAEILERRIKSGLITDI